MRDCRTFLKLQEAFGSKQTEAQNQGYTGAPGSIAYNEPPANGGASVQGQPNLSNKNNGGYIMSRGHIAAMIQPVPKLKK
jgi:hypothetical protein